MPNTINTMPTDDTGAVDIAALRRLHGIRDDDPDAARLTGEAITKEAEQFARINPHAVVSQAEAEATVTAMLGTLVADTTEPAVEGMHPILFPPPKGEQH